MDNIHQTVWDGLKEGYGAEDIAVNHHLNIEKTHECIRHFRSAGKLPALYGRAKKLWAKQKSPQTD